MAKLTLTTEQLIEHALENNEGVLASNGALRVTTGKRTGRSPNDRFIVRDQETEHEVDWNHINKPIATEIFDALWTKVGNYLDDAPNTYFCELHVGAHEQEYIPVNVQTELAWHNLFAQTLFIVPEAYNPLEKRTWSIRSAPKLKLDPSVDGTNSDGCVMLNFTEKKILIAGIEYAGEMKKACFSVLNYRLPSKNILPMHCSANISELGRTTVFFGLSGTGKTTLSADPNSDLIGDDEHGWTDGKVFNFEGGCYAKCINLTEENEPVIWHALKRGSVLENVVLDDQGNPKFEDDSITENTRATYPRVHIEKRADANNGPEPSALVFLTCDLNSVFPPVAKLSPDAAAYHFLSGYTAAMAGTEVGAEVKPTFSACFGAPFFPRPPRVYAELLKAKMQANNVPVYLVNTGWTGGPINVGSRFPIRVTRAIVQAIQDGSIEKSELLHLDELNMDIPLSVPGVDSKYLNPRESWADKDAYQATLQKVIEQFAENFKQFDVSDSVRAAGPKL